MATARTTLSVAYCAWTRSSLTAFWGSSTATMTTWPAGPCLPQTSSLPTPTIWSACCAGLPRWIRCWRSSGKREKIERFKQEAGEDVRRALLQRGLVFGRLMWAARQIDPSVASLPVARFMDEATWEVNEDRLFSEAANGVRKDESTLRGRVAELPQADPWHVVRGHELIELLRIGLRRRLGNLPASTGVAAIGRVLRAAMPEEELQATAMWRDMTRWEASNTPYRVLPG